MTQTLDPMVERHLNLQVKISYADHHAFLLRHGLDHCSHILDVGTGNAAFASLLAQDHPDLEFVGIDKRSACIASCQPFLRSNLSVQPVDMFARESQFDFSRFDGFLMRYFLLHVDNAQKILEVFRQKAKRPSQFWIIDLDYSQFACEPRHKTFDQLTQLVADFCAKVSVRSLNQKQVLPMLEELGFEKITVEHVPFTNERISLEDFTLYLKQEVLCYSMMMGKAQDQETAEILRFIEEDLSSGKFRVSYGMMLVSAELG